MQMFMYPFRIRAMVSVQVHGPTIYVTANGVRNGLVSSDVYTCIYTYYMSIRPRRVPPFKAYITLCFFGVALGQITQNYLRWVHLILIYDREANTYLKKKKCFFFLIRPKKYLTLKKQTKCNIGRLICFGFINQCKVKKQHA